MVVIRVTMEIWPGGDSRRARKLAEGTITNDDTGTKSVGNYQAAFWRKDPRRARHGEVKGFPRLTGSPWDLIARCLAAAGYVSEQPHAPVPPQEAQR